ncbi:hypothetical protein E2542_SST06974 [Spatholobus suberectus]|nr:hypothetical protein E2542_SST06974 [Spatholobus suberectus]
MGLNFDVFVWVSIPILMDRVTRVQSRKSFGIRVFDYSVIPALPIAVSQSFRSAFPSRDIKSTLDVKIKGIKQPENRTINFKNHIKFKINLCGKGRREFCFVHSQHKSKVFSRYDALQKAAKNYTIEATPDDMSSAATDLIHESDSEGFTTWHFHSLSTCIMSGRDLCVQWAVATVCKERQRDSCKATVA